MRFFSACWTSFSVSPAVRNRLCSLLNKECRWPVKLKNLAGPLGVDPEGNLAEETRVCHALIKLFGGGLITGQKDDSSAGGHLKLPVGLLGERIGARVREQFENVGLQRKAVHGPDHEKARHQDQSDEPRDPKLGPELSEQTASSRPPKGWAAVEWCCRISGESNRRWPHTTSPPPPFGHPPKRLS